MKEKREIHAGYLLAAILVVSLGSAALITDWHAGGVTIFLDMLFWSAVIFAALFFLSAVVIGIFKIPLKEAPSTLPEKGGKATSVYLDREEDEEEKKARRKALRRIKKLQRDYPDMWELMVDPDDEYLCFDYLYERDQKKRKRQAFETSIFGASCTNDGQHDSGDCS